MARILVYDNVIQFSGRQADATLDIVVVMVTILISPFSPFTHVLQYSSTTVARSLSSASYTHSSACILVEEQVKESQKIKKRLSEGGRSKKCPSTKRETLPKTRAIVVVYQPVVKK